MSDLNTCPQCGYAIPSGDAEPALAGLCPRCLAGGVGKPEMTEPSLRTDNARIPIETIRPPLKPGASFKGFEVLEVLGQGGMGVVYKARQQSLNRLVALKLLNSQLATSEEFAARFEREARVLASLNHPNVVQVFDFGKEDGLLYLVMEHVDGPTLEDVLKKKADPARFLAVVRDVARGLERIHQAGLVHRDVKPSNILIAKDGTAKISDFGLAIETEGSQKLTQSGMFVGTPHYVSPEHAQAKKVDGRSDLYSLGVILFEGFAGRPPFQAPSATALLLKHVNEPPPALYKLAPQSPRAVQEIVRKLLAKNPAARHDTASSLVRDLDRALEEPKAPKVPGTARKAPAPAPSPEPSKLPIKWIGAGVAAVAVIAILVAVLSGKSEPPVKEEKPAPPMVANRPAPPPPKHDEEKPKEPEPPPAVPAPAVPPPSDPKPPPQDPKPPSAVEEALRQGDKLFEEARAAFEDGKARSSVEALTDAGFKADAAKIKFLAVQEIGGDELKAKAADQLKLIQQFGKLVNEARLAIQEAKGVNPAAAPAPAPAPENKPANPAAAPVVRPAPVAAPARVAAPEASTLKDAEKTIRDIYKAEYAKKTAADQLALAQKLLKQSRETVDDPKAAFVLLREARDLALQAGDLDVAVAAIDEMSVRFEIDLLAAKNAALTRLAGTVRTPETAAALAEAFIDLARLAVEADSYDVAVAASTRADSLAKSSPDAAARIQDLRREIAAIKDEYLKVKSSIDKPGTGDPEALGKFYAFVKGEWDRGLTILSASAKPPLNGLAEKDLAAPADAAAQVEVGDGWWDLAEKEKILLRKTHLQERARYWYETAFSAVTGLSKTKIEKRLDALDAAVKGPVDLLKLIDARLDAVNGSWKMERGTLVSPQDWFGRLQVRYLPPEEYDLRIVVERKVHDEDFYIGLVKGDAQIGLCIDAGHGTYTTMGDMAPLTASAPRYDGKLLADNRPSTIVCSVRKKSVSVMVDGKKVLSYSWKGDEGRGFLPGKWEIPNKKALFIGAHGTVFNISRLTLTGISGQGRMDRSGGVSAPPTARSVSELRPAAIPKGAVDLLGLIDTAKDSVIGTWKFSPKGLTSPLLMNALLQIPYAPSEEYDLEVVVELKDGSDGFGIGLPQGASQVMAVIGSWGQTCNGLRLLAGKYEKDNETAFRGPVFVKGRPSKIFCSVRREKIEVVVDGKKIVSWKPDFSRVTLDAWAVPEKEALFFCSLYNTYEISRAVVTPVGGQGRLLRDSLSAPPRGSVDLLAAIDPKFDFVNGPFTLDGSGLLTPPGVLRARVSVPYTPPAEYDFTMVVERKDGVNSLNYGVPWGGKLVSLVVDGKGPAIEDAAGMDFINGKPFFDNETTTKGPFLPLGRAATVVTSVRKGSLTMTIDGRTVFSWKGDPSRLAENPAIAVPTRGTFSVGCYDTSFLIRQMMLLPVSGQGAFLRKPPAPRAVDLLALVDPKRDGVSGDYVMDGRTLVTPAATDYARIQIPYVPPAEYDLVMEVERTQGDNCLAIGLVGQQQFVCVLDGGFGTDNSALDVIDEKTMMANETTVKGKQIEKGKRATIACSVRKNAVTVTVDGRKVIEWRGAFSRLHLWSNWAVPRKNALLLGSCMTEYRITRMELTPRP